MKHIFAICAYKDSPYLEDCIASLQAQEEKSPILLCTATPSDKLAALAEKHGLTYCINPDKPNIAGDWNFALAQAKAQGAAWCTLCHQDDLYLPGYGAALRKDADEGTLIWFSDYGEQRGSERVNETTLLKIKRLLLWSLRVKGWQRMRWAKRAALALGDAICCPAVSFNLEKLPLPLFERGMTTNLDWQTWEKLSLLPGRFAYCPQPLMLHRIHPGSTTSQVLGEGGRTQQDYEMFCKFWPRWIARILTRVYGLSEKSNNL